MFNSKNIYIGIATAWVISFIVWISVTYYLQYSLTKKHNKEIKHLTKQLRIKKVKLTKPTKSILESPAPAVQTDEESDDDDSMHYMEAMD